MDMLRPCIVLEELTTLQHDGIASNMKAKLVMRQRATLDDDSFIEIVIWKLPQPLAGSSHDYKYRMALVCEKKCVLRYDNEAGKGDHKHLEERESIYDFKGIDRLLDDFYGAVERWRLR